MKKLDAKVYIEQVIDGIKYKGDISFGDKYKVKYELNLDQNIANLDKLAENDLEAAKSQMHITIKDYQNQEIIISEDLFPLFQALIIPFASEFYQAPLTRGLNSPETKSLDRMLESFGGSRSMGASQTQVFDGDVLEPLLIKNFIKTK